MGEGIKEAHRCLSEFKRILQPSFGPWGKDVLFRTDTGTIHVTKDGDSILRHLEIKHPIGLLITNAAKRYKQEVGDFSKTFILILAHLVELFAVKCTEKNAVHNGIQSFVGEVSQSISNLQNLLSSRSLIQYINDSLRQSKFHVEELTMEVMDGLFQSFVCNTFSAAACQQIKRICVEIFQTISLSKANIKHLIDDFLTVCIVVHGLPLQHSKVLTGMIIEREPTPCNAHIQTCRFVVICDELVRAGVDMTMNAKEDFFESQDRWSAKFFTSIVNMLIDHDVNIVFVEEKLPALFQSTLTFHKIAYVQHVPKEDITRLTKLYKVSVLSGLYDISSVQCVNNVVGRSSFFKSCILGKKYCCHIGPLVVDSKSDIMQVEILNIQLLLCVMSEGIAQHYRDTIHSYLKVLHNSFEGESGGACSLLPSGGAFEILVSDYCQQMDRSHFSDLQVEIVDWFSGSLLEVPKLLFSNSNKLKTKRIFFNYKYLQHEAAPLNAVVSVNGTTGSLEDSSKLNLFEPFKSKTMLLSNILDVCSQIVRIDQSVPIRTYVRNMNSDEEDAEAN